MESLAERPETSRSPRRSRLGVARALVAECEGDPRYALAADHGPFTDGAIPTVRYGASDPVAPVSQDLPSGGAEQQWTLTAATG